MVKHHRVLFARALAAWLLFSGVQAILHAHDVPEEIDIQAYIKPQGTRLQVVLRVPLLAVSDTNLPKDSTGYLAMPYIDPAIGEAANQISTGILLLENDERLSQFNVASARISLPSDKSFDTYAGAVTHVRGPKLPDSTQIYYNQGYLDLEMLYPIRSASDEFGVQVLLSHGLANRTVTFVDYVRPDGGARVFRLVDQTDVVHLDPSWVQAVRVFVADGFFQFLNGIDQLLFVVVLVLPYRRVRDVAAPLASFAAASTITLTIGGFGFMPSGNWFPMFVGALIALSVLYVAIEDALGVNLRKRWMVASGFGLVHGFGFAFALRDSLQFAGGHSLAALLSFGAGLELGLIIILAIALPAFSLLFTQVVSERAGTIAISVLAGHAAWHWMADRFATLQLMSLPVLDLALAATVVRWLLILTVGGGGLWLLTGLLRRRRDPSEFSEEKSIVDTH